MLRLSFSFTCGVCFARLRALCQWTCSHTNDHSYEMDNYENVNEAAAQQTVASALRIQLKSFFSQHELSTRAARTGLPPGPSTADTSDPYDV